MRVIDGSVEVTATPVRLGVLGWASAGIPFAGEPRHVGAYAGSQCKFDDFTVTRTR